MAYVCSILNSGRNVSVKHVVTAISSRCGVARRSRSGVNRRLKREFARESCKVSLVTPKRRVRHNTHSGSQAGERAHQLQVATMLDAFAIRFSLTKFIVNSQLRIS